MTDAKPVLLIDLSSIGHPIGHVSQQEPDPDYTSQRIVAIVRQLAAEHPHTAICCDSPISFRKDIDPKYKANRPVRNAALYHQIDLAIEALAADGFPVWKVDEFEGDDVIATATARLTDIDHDVLIASADKDLLALVGEHVEVHSTRTGNRIGPPEVRSKLGVDPGLVVDYLTLVGDSSDNIKGANGIGPINAVELLDAFGTVDNIYFAIDNGKDESLKPAQRASLLELRTRLDNVRALVTMRTDVPLDVNEVFKPRVPTTTEFMKGETNMKDDTTPMDTPPTRIAASSMEPKKKVETAAPLAPAQPPTAADDVIQVEPVTLVEVETLPAPADWDRALEPRCMEEAYRLAQCLHNSKTFLGDYGTPQAVLSTILLGREIGLPAMASLRSVHIIEGKHSLSAELMVALVLKSGLAEFFQLVETTDKVCTYETKRKDAPKPQKLSYTIEQAEQADLLKPSRSGRPTNWEKMPKQMLRARCKSELARLEYPDLLAGLYTPEELRDAKNGD